MRKILIVLYASGIFMLQAVPTFAAYVGSTVNGIEEGEIVVGAEVNMVSLRELGSGFASYVDVKESDQFGIKASYGINQELSAYLKLGAADYLIKKGFLNLTKEMEYSFSPYYGVGLRYMREKENNVVYGADLQYITQPDGSPE